MKQKIGCNDLKVDCTAMNYRCLLLIGYSSLVFWDGTLPSLI